LGRRQPPKTDAQKKAEKRAYDMENRRKNKAAFKAKKAAYFRATYDPEKARIERKKRAPQHAEYCRRPAYKKWKRQYDSEYRAKQFGAFAEAYKLAIELSREIKTRTNDYEIRIQNQTYGKAQKRDREAHGEDRRRPV